MNHALRLHWQKIVLGIGAAGFFFAYAWFPFVTTRPAVNFPSPDATANYFWTVRFAEAGKLWYADAANLSADDIVHPRSMRSDAGMVKPVSFLGIILLYGTVAKLAGVAVVPYLSALVAAAGAGFLYGIARRIFDRRIAFAAAGMLLPLAPYWYHASRGMFHNVLFTVLALGGAWLALVTVDTRRTLAAPVSDGNENVPFLRLYTLATALFAGIFFGLALLTRTAEAPWLGVLMGVLLIAMWWPLHRPQWRSWLTAAGWLPAIMFVTGVAMALVPLFYYNTLLYGEPLNFGYPSRINRLIETVQTGVTGGTAAAAVPWWDAVFEILFPFEVHPRAAWRHFQQYYADMFWYLCWPAAAGLLWLAGRLWKTPLRQWLYLGLWLGISGYIVFLYGSWMIRDNPSGAATIGNSYTRYWLPLYVMALPVAAAAIVQVSEWLSRIAAWLIRKPAAVPYATAVLAGAAVIAFGTLNAREALYGNEEGLVRMAAALQRDQALVHEVLPAVPAEAVVISERYDKFFFPQRRVIVGALTDNAYNERYARLARAGFALYYYGFMFPEKDFNYLNDRKLAEVGLHLEPVRLQETAGVGLYRLQPVR